MNKFYKQEDEERLVALHTPLVVSIAFSYKPKPPNDHEDLISVGMIGLLKAIRSYDPSLGTQFSTLATVVIHREIIRELNKSNSNHLEQIDADIEQKEETKIIDFLPESLDESEKSILYSRYYLNKTYEEIGKELGFTKQWAHMRISNILDKIRNSNESKKTKDTTS